MSVPLPFPHRTVGGIHCAVGGSGPPLLLLHGYPQTHVIWHHVAPLLAERFTVVAAALRGYGDSMKPAPETDNYSKRAMASIDLDHDEADAGRPLTCPVLALWGRTASSAAPTTCPRCGASTRPTFAAGRSPPTTTLPEEAPAEVAAALTAFAYP